MHNRFNTGRKSVAKAKIGLRCYGMYKHMSEPAEVAKENIRSRNHTGDQGRGCKSKCKQEKTNEGIGTPRALS